MKSTNIFKTIRLAYNIESFGSSMVVLEDVVGNELRATTKLCMNRIKKSGILPEPSSDQSTVFRMLDWCRNCGAEPLAEEILSYVGILPTKDFTFELVFSDELCNVPRLPLQITMRTYIWRQVDDNRMIDYAFGKLRETLNKDLANQKHAGRYVINRDENPVECRPTKLVRYGAENGPPFDRGIALGPSGEELDDNDQYLDQFYY
uniref:Uncharacterized protein n=1 Tax=viral metagenome TaxID=1070528 RepID=A0A6C0F0J5_9ZZZZ